MRASLLYRRRDCACHTFRASAAARRAPSTTPTATVGVEDEELLSIFCSSGTVELTPIDVLAACVLNAESTSTGGSKPRSNCVDGWQQQSPSGTLRWQQKVLVELQETSVSQVVSDRGSLEHDLGQLGSCQVLSVQAAR